MTRSSQLLLLLAIATTTTSLAHASRERNRSQPVVAKAKTTKASVRPSGLRPANKIVDLAKLPGQELPALGYDDSYAGGEGTVTILKTGGAQAKRVTMLYFHGAGQATDNEMLRRFANAYHNEGVALAIHSVPYAKNVSLPKEVRKAYERGELVVAGHSAGGGKAAEFVKTNPKAAGLITFNGTNHGAPNVPSLIFRGENDGGSRILHEMPYELFWQQAGQPVIATRQGNTIFAVAAEGDHSLRYRKAGDNDKAAASTTPQTKQMNAGVARAVREFIVSLGL